MGTLYRQSWAIEYYPENVNTRIVIGVAGITPPDAHRRITDAGFSDFGVEFDISESQLAGAVFTRLGPVTVGPGSVILSRTTVGSANRVMLGGAVGGSGERTPQRRFALTVAHLFNKVGTARGVGV